MAEQKRGERGPSLQRKARREATWIELKMLPC